MRVSLCFLIPYFYIQLHIILFIVVIFDSGFVSSHDIVGRLKMDVIFTFMITYKTYKYAFVCDFIILLILTKNGLAYSIYFPNGKILNKSYGRLA